jgi:hypothetical protein
MFAREGEPPNGNVLCLCRLLQARRLTCAQKEKERERDRTDLQTDRQPHSRPLITLITLIRRPPTWEGTDGRGEVPEGVVVT